MVSDVWINIFPPIIFLTFLAAVSIIELNNNLIEVELICFSLSFIIILFAGLPTKVNPDEFDRIWNLCHDLEPQSMTLIAALLASEEEVTTDELYLYQ